MVSINEASLSRLTYALSAIMAENLIQIRENSPFVSIQDCSASNPPNSMPLNAILCVCALHPMVGCPPY